MKKLVIILIIALLFNRVESIAQASSIEPIVYYTHILFPFQDSLLEKTIFWKNIGHSYQIVDGHVRVPEENSITYIVIKRDLEEVKYVESDFSLVELENYYPNLLIDKKAIINNYDFELADGYYYNQQIYYSYLLTQLNAPKLSRDTNVLRIIMDPSGDCSPGEYEVYNYDFRTNTFHFISAISKGDGMFTINFEYSDNPKKNRRKRFMKQFEMCDFEKQRYYDEIGLNIQNKFFIEYYDNNKRYVFNKHYGNKEFRKLYGAMINLRNIKKEK